jgi:hypothetical protein
VDRICCRPRDKVPVLQREAFAAQNAGRVRCAAAELRQWFCGPAYRSLSALVAAVYGPAHCSRYWRSVIRTVTEAEQDCTFASQGAARWHT